MELSYLLHVIVYAGIFLLLVTDTFFLIKGSNRILKLKSVSLELGGAKMEAEKADDESPLYKNRDALIQALVDSTDRIDRTVIFEDMDRLKGSCCVELFTKLWELNKLANLRLDNNKPMRFVYVLHDELFSLASDKRKKSSSPEAEELAGEKVREPVLPATATKAATNQEANQTTPDSYVQLKFFDYILPIIPSMSAKDAIVVAKNLIQDEDVNELITLLAPYLYDYRLLRNIVNEYSIFCRIYSERSKTEQPKKKKRVFEHNKCFFSSLWSCLSIFFNAHCQEEPSISILSKEEKKKVLGFSIYKNLMPEDYKRIREGKSIVFPDSQSKANDPNLSMSIRILVENRWLDDTCLHFVGYNREGLRGCIKSTLGKGAETAKQQQFWLEHEPVLCCEFLINEGPQIKLDGIEFTVAALALTEEGKQLVEIIEEKSKDVAGAKEICSDSLLGKIHANLGLGEKESVLNVNERRKVFKYLVSLKCSELQKFVPGSNKQLNSDQNVWWTLIKDLDESYTTTLVDLCKQDLKDWALSEAGKTFLRNIPRSEEQSDMYKKINTLTSI